MVHSFNARKNLFFAFCLFWDTTRVQMITVPFLTTLKGSQKRAQHYAYFTGCYLVEESSVEF